MWLNVLAVKYYYNFSCYMVVGSVMVTFISKQVNTFDLLEINCKINSLGSAKIPYFVHKRRHGALLCLENTLKLFCAS